MPQWAPTVRLFWGQQWVLCGPESQALGLLGCPDSAFVCAIKVEEECKQWYSPAPLALESVPWLPGHLIKF